MYDVIVIGSGPAGITAAIYAKRRNLSILVISKGNGTLQKAEKIDNYYGFENGISGKELYVNGIKQAKNLGIDFIEDEVINIEYINQFTIETVNSKYEAKAVILATGVSRNVPNIKGIKEFEGKGVSYCAVCDSFFYKGKDVAVLGDGNYAIHEFETLKPIASSVTILTNGNTMVENRDSSIEVNSKKIREFRGDTKLEEVEFEDNTIQNLNGVFIAMGTASSSDLARKIGARIENNNIIVNENMETTVPGLFACGDCTGGLLQISKAVYEGAKAGLAVLKNN
jgi:thioredoxin reductase (NADPH)